MLRHDFQPGKLVSGVFLTGAGVVYAGDAAGAWQAPWFLLVPMVVGGLCLGGAAAVVNRAVRRRRDARATLGGTSAGGGTG
ncbi:hypothetical protein ACIQMV_34195 [Streptomyces sp. NPDC091412]|uniref:hypothetical protein n=1 Tax=Streptomyces sp. NPDC091412 TaxID=3366002 RepID=UPI00380F8C65